MLQQTQVSVRIPNTVRHPIILLIQTLTQLHLLLQNTREGHQNGVLLLKELHCTALSCTLVRRAHTSTHCCCKVTKILAPAASNHLVLEQYTAINLLTIIASSFYCQTKHLKRRLRECVRSCLRILCVRR